ncbi:MAG: hypothetical protein ACFFCI_09525 [Promethearchaeota archaeon]
MKRSNKQSDKDTLKSKMVNDLISVKSIKTNLINQKRAYKAETCYKGDSKLVIYIINEPVITIHNTQFPIIEKSIFKLNQSPNPQKNKVVNNNPEDIFNIVVHTIFRWCENNYNSQFLDYRIALPLLRKLREVGDTKFQIILQQEILRNYVEGNYQVKDYLKSEGYLELIGDFF